VATDPIKPSTLREWIRWYDPRVLLRLLLLGTAAWVVPEAGVPALARRFASFAAAYRRSAAAVDLAKLPPAYVAMCGAEPDEIVRESTVLSAEEAMQVLRCYRPGAQLPKVTLAGADNIELALARGSGAVLWAGEFMFLHLLGKIALWQQGYRVVHLSRDGHGFAGGAKGLRRLNAISQSLETRFLAQRVVIQDNQFRPALRQLERALEANGVVSISVGTEASQVLTTPFLGGELLLPSGPLNLCRQTGAPLLPLMLRRTGANAFEVEVGQPIPVDRDIDRKAAFQDATGAYAAALEAFLSRHPQLWRGWWQSWQPLPAREEARAAS
jgi:lauroyl/myristoyl acyltransferase